jgi:hypothetical protein
VNKDGALGSLLRTTNFLWGWGVNVMIFRLEVALASDANLGAYGTVCFLAFSAAILASIII